MTESTKIEEADPLRKALSDLMYASAPYLTRKKMTPRSECNKLNEVFNRCLVILEEN